MGVAESTIAAVTRMIHMMPHQLSRLLPSPCRLRFLAFFSYHGTQFPCSLFRQFSSLLSNRSQQLSTQTVIQQVAFSSYDHDGDS